MRNLYKVSFLFLSMIALFALFGMNHTIAAEKVEWTEYESETTNDVNKEWSITFSDKPEENSVNSENIYVEDSTGATVKTNLHLHGNIVKVLPEVSYEAGKSYTLYIGPNIQSAKHKIIKTAVKFTFTVINEQTSPKFTADLINVDGRFGYVKLAISNQSTDKVEYFFARYPLQVIPKKGDIVPTEAIEYKTGDEFVLWQGHELFAYLVDENNIIIEIITVDQRGQNPMDFQITDNQTLLVKTTYLPESNETVADFMYYIYIANGMKRVEKVTDFSTYEWQKIDGIYAIDIKFDNGLYPNQVGQLQMRSKKIGAGYPLGFAPYDQEFFDIFMLHDWARVEKTSDHKMQFSIILERIMQRSGESNIIENNTISTLAYIDRVKADEFPLQTMQEVVNMVKQVNKEIERKIAPYKLAKGLVANLFKEGYHYLPPKEQLRDDVTKQDVEKAKAAVQLLGDEFKIEKEQLLTSIVFAEYYLNK